MTTPNPPLRDDEFDIEQFAHKLNTVAGKAWNKLTYPVRVLFIRPLLLLLLVLLGLGAGYTATRVLPPVYQASFVIRPNNMGDLMAITQFYDLEQATKRGDAQALSAALGIEERMAKAIRRIHAEVVWKSARKDSIVLFEIRLRSLNAGDFDSLQYKILDYLESNPHYTLIRKLREEDIAERKAQVKNDLEEIDSLKHLMAQNMQPRSAGGFVYGEAPDPVKVYEAAFKLYNEKSSLNWQKAFIGNFEMLKPCMPASERYSPNLYRILAIGAAAGIVLCFILNQARRKRKTA